MPDLWRVMKNTLQLVFVAELLAVLIAVVIGVYFGVTPILGLRLLGDDLQLPRTGHASLLARAHAAGGGGADLRTHGAPTLPDRGSQLRGSRNGGQLLDRPCASPRAAGDRADGGEHRDVLALHARRDARGRQLRLCPHRACQGADREAGDDETRVPQRVDPARHAGRAQLRRAPRRRRSSPRRSSRWTAWVSTS